MRGVRTILLTASASADPLPMERDPIFMRARRPPCDKCHRDAITNDDLGMLLCARHATIFMTIERMDSDSARTVAAPVASSSR